MRWGIMCTARVTLHTVKYLLGAFDNSEVPANLSSYGLISTPYQIRTH